MGILTSEVKITIKIELTAEGKREGRGVYIFANKDLYQGQWLSDKKHGEGTFKYSNGESYHGEW
jgi:hypothetical protein